MNIFQHLEKIDGYIKDTKESNGEDMFFSGMVSNLGIGLNSNASWDTKTSSSFSKDCYRDSI